MIDLVATGLNLLAQIGRQSGLDLGSALEGTALAFPDLVALGPVSLDLAELGLACLGLAGKTRRRRSGLSVDLKSRRRS